MGNKKYKCEDCPRQKIFTLRMLLLLYWQSSHSLNVLFTLFSMLGQFSFQKNIITLCLSESKSSNFPCSSLFYPSVALGQNL